MKTGSLNNHGDSLIGITAEKDLRHHTQVELYEAEPDLRPGFSPLKAMTPPITGSA